MKKKICCLLAVLVLLIGLGACVRRQDSGGEEETTESTTEAVSTEATQPAQDEEEATSSAPTESQGESTTRGQSESTQATTAATTTSATNKVTTTAKPTTTTTAAAASGVEQKATYSSGEFYKAYKARKFYVEFEAIETKGDAKNTLVCVRALDGDKEYLKTTINGTPIMTNYTTDGEKVHSLLNASGLKVDSIMPFKEAAKEGSKSIYQTMLEFDEQYFGSGQYQKTTTEKDKLIEHYKDGEYTRLIIFSLEDGKPGELIGFSIEKTDGTKATIAIRNFSQKPESSLFKTPLGYIKLDLTK
jgi:hypothetical protein